MREALVSHDQVLGDVIGAHGGVVFSTGGDGFAAAFGRAGEALATAVEAQRVLVSVEWPDPAVVRVRMGLTARPIPGALWGTEVLSI